MKTPTPEEFAEWQKKFEAWTKDAIDRAREADSLRRQNNLLDGIAVDQARQIAAFEDELNRWKLEAAEQQGFATRHQREAAKAQQATVFAQRQLSEAHANMNAQAATIRDLRDLLTSAHAIAARGGEDTNWEAFIRQLRDRGIGSITAKVFKLPKDDAVFWNPGNGVVQNHRDGTVIQPDTDKERAKRGLPPFVPDPGPQKLRDWIRHAINCVSAENESDTPDFILADYLMASLDAFDAATRTREKWYGREQKSVDDLPQVTETPAS